MLLRFFLFCVQAFLFNVCGGLMFVFVFFSLALIMLFNFVIVIVIDFRFFSSVLPFNLYI